MADFLVALADFDARRVWLKLGYSSLFVFLHRHLGLSKGASHFRKVAAELVQRFPEVIDPLRDGRLCITSVVELARVITLENRAEVLPRFFHASKQEAKAVAADIRPADVVPRREVVTVVSTSASLATNPPLPTETPPSAPLPVAIRQNGAEVRPVELLRQAAAPRPSQIEPLSADARRLHVTVSKRFLEKLEVAKAALSHSHPGAGAEAILEAGLDLLIERAARRKGIVSRPRSQPPKSEKAAPRAIPAAVSREVWIVIPVARGGRSTVENLRLLCARHNDLAARHVFGDDWMDQFTLRAGRSAEERCGDVTGAS